MSESKVLLISVGGSQDQLIYSAVNHLPDKIIFFTSPDSRKLVNDLVLPAVYTAKKQIPDHEIIVTSEPQDVGVSVRALLNNVPHALKKLGISDKLWPDVVDYTGGTKSMSAAVVWASAKYPCRLSYVGTKSKTGRTKDGLGIVESGKECLLTIENPWDKIAYFEVESAMLLFKQAQYASSAAILKSILDKISDDKLKMLVSSLYNVVEGYASWDAFDHKKAKHLLASNRDKLLNLSELEQILIPGIKSFTVQVIENIDFLRDMPIDKLSWPMIYDLLANSARRAFIERKYEDASARCYAAIEKIAKYELQKTYGINTSNASPELLPEECRAEYIRKYTVKQLDGSEAIKFGVVAAYEILRVLKNPFGVRFSEIENIRSHLNERNSSILAHGIQPMDEAKFKNLFSDALKLLDTTENQLVKFPTFKL